ncbi:MAG: ATP-dependent RecD-like DNA helicase [Sphingobacteriaceae bacterium]
MSSFVAQLTTQFGKTPTSQQQEAFHLLERFLLSDADKDCLLLKGYAGTGKTTLISALVKVLPKFPMKSVLLAPTGRAAKVMSNYSGKKASTIHKRIYRKKQAVSPDMQFSLAQNLLEDTVFIVDEASMIADEPTDYSGTGLLQDLMEYVYNDKGCKLILVGDTAQLPPVGVAESPALDREYLHSRYGLNIFSTELTEVVRQEKESGILHHATHLREIIRKAKVRIPKLHTKGFKDIYHMTGERLVEGLHYAYDKYGMENTLVVCRSNKNANAYNQNIRNRILLRDEELSGGDYVMVVRNNYYWLNDTEKNGNFIANGDVAKIRKVKNISEQYGFRFADVVLELVDYPDEEPLTCKVMLDTLYAETPSLSYADSKRLYEAISADYAHIANKRLRLLELKKDPYYNALQIKFAFAVTCHKAQGGQWDAVFIDQGYLTEELINIEFLRWLYTAITRSSKELFLVNFGPQFQ